MPRLSAPRGTRDIVDNEASAFRCLEERARSVFAVYGFEEIRTPAFENADLFSRAVGSGTDIVEKEMYSFEDRGGRTLSLRPEGTAGVVRAYLEHGWDQSSPGKKLWYAGPMFRAERPQAGRYREFWQLGAEIFGNSSPQADAEAMFLARDILSLSGLTSGVQFKVNSIGCPRCRPAYRESLKSFLETRRSGLCEDCARRVDRNPLRALDCKIDGPHLSEAPLMADHLCDECRRHRAEVDTYLRAGSFPFVESPRLVRGLDYYTRTVFEVTSPGVGAQDAIGAGGRYDGLVKLLGGPDTPAVGFALGIDRVALALQTQGFRTSGPVKIFVAQAGEGTAPAAFDLAQSLRSRFRQANLPVAVDRGASTKSVKAQFRAADGWGARWLVLVGEEELKRGAVVVKDLQNHSQREVPIADVPETVLGFVRK